MCVRKQYPIGESLLTSLLTFSVFSIRLNPWNNRRMYESNLKNLKELVLLEQFVQFSASSLQALSKDIGAIENHEFAVWQKRQFSHAFFVEFRVFQRESFGNCSVYRVQNFTDNLNRHAPSIFRECILIA